MEVFVMPFNDPVSNVDLTSSTRFSEKNTKTADKLSRSWTRDNKMSLVTKRYSKRRAWQSVKRHTTANISLSARDGVQRHNQKSTSNRIRPGRYVMDLLSETSCELHNNDGILNVSVHSNESSISTKKTASVSPEDNQKRKFSKKTRMSASDEGDKGGINISKKEGGKDEMAKLCFLLYYPAQLLSLGGYKVPLGKTAIVCNPDKAARVKRLLGVVNRSFMRLLHFANLIRTVAFCAVHVVNANDTVMVMSIEALFFMLYGTAVNVAEHISMRLHFPSFIGALESYSRDFGFLNEISEGRRFVRILACSVCFDIVLFSVIWTYFGIINNDEYILFPFQAVALSEGIKKMVYIDTALTIAFLGIPIFGFGMLYTGLLRFIRLEFDTNRQRLIEILTDNDNSTESRFDYCRDRHQALCQLVAALSRVTRLYVVLTLFFDMVVTCLSIYGVSNPQATKEMILAQVFNIFISLPRTVFLVSSWGRLQSSAHSIGTVLRKVSWTRLPETLLHKINITLTRCSTTKIGIDVYGLFVIEKTTVMMISGTLVTYGVVVLQFQFDKNLPVTCLVPANHTIN